MPLKNSTDDVWNQVISNIEIRSVAA